MKILITGGHITPAIAIIEELKKYPGVEIIFVGRKYTTDIARSGRDRSLSFEYQTITSLNISFIHLKTGRLTRIISIKTLLDFLKFPFGLYEAYKIVKKQKPKIILSFGGYIAFPIALVSYFLKIPVFTHEQTLIPGLANKIIARFAQKVFISFPETAGFFKNKNVVYTGNPLRKEILVMEMREEKTFYKGNVRLLIIGGSLGSHFLNLLIEKLLPRLLDKFKIIHIAGDDRQYRDFDRLSKIGHKNYKVYKYLYSKELAEEFCRSDLIICRAGANTIFELIALAKPAVLIPLPWSAEGEQYAHAKFLKEKGAVEVFYQNSTYPDCCQASLDKDADKSCLSDLPDGSQADRLFGLIVKIINNWKEYHKNYSQLKNYHQKNAAETIIKQVLAEK